MKKILSALLCCTVLYSTSQSLTTSLTACYELNGSASEPINSLTGTISAATATVDRFSNASSALQFNGTTNCFVTLPDDPLIKPSSDISFALWVKPESLAGGMHIVYTKNNQSSNFEAYQFEIFNGVSWRLNKANSTLNNIVLSTTTVVLNQWCHIACTIDNTSLKLYVNGVLEGTTPSTFNGFDYQTGKKVYLGGTNESFNHPFIGALDNLKFWNRVITQSEVTLLYQTDPACAASPAPTASFVISSSTVCAGGGVTFTNSSTNATTLNWQLTGPSALSSTLSNPSFTLPVAGIYTVNLTASNSTGTNAAVKTITVHPNPTLTLTSSTNSICIGSTLNLQASGAVTYSWSTSQSGSSIQATPSVNTIYTVKGISNFGCSSTTSIAIAVHPIPAVTLTANSNSICLGATATLQASGATSYSWSAAQSSFSIQITPTATSIYTVQGTNGQGCSATSSISIEVKTCLDVSIKEFTSEVQLSYFPNPVKDILHVQSQINQKVTLQDINGTFLQHYELKANEPTKINLSEYPSGIYFLKNDRTNTKPLKFIKE